MLDALIPAKQAFENSLNNGDSLENAMKATAKAAEMGTKETANMVAKRGRSSYLGNRVLGHIDPGAQAVTIIIQSIVDTLTGVTSI